jgi:hypothetical protein
MVAAFVAAGVVFMSMAWRIQGSATLQPGDAEAALRTADVLYLAPEPGGSGRGSSHPFWFVYDGQRAFVSPAPTSWSPPRLRDGSAVRVNVGHRDGPALRGRAEYVTEPVLLDWMGSSYAQKYWLAWLGLFQPRSAHRAQGKTPAYVVAFARAESQLNAR